MKKAIKKVVKPFVKPLTNRFGDINNQINDLYYQLENTNKGIFDYKTDNNNRVNGLINENNIINGNIQGINNSLSSCLANINKLENDNVALSKENTYLKSFINSIALNDIDNIFYYHGGSGNHGCEALVRTLCKICDFSFDKTLLYSYQYQEDYEFGLNNIIGKIISSKLSSDELFDYYKKGAIALSIGGDNYCGYPYPFKNLAGYNEAFNKKGVKTALVGCSIEPDVLNHQEVLDDLEQFSLITARETITYDALLKHGINNNTKLIPDSAFTLDSIELPLPDNFIEGKTIGLNLSNVVQGYDSKIYDNYINMIKYIIDNTDYNVALIPHVIQSFNDDLVITNRLYREFCDTGRVCLIPNCNCMELKGYIKRCVMFIGARTHSTIAAYSTCVPTLVVGYSVKSKGIAKDLFGTYDNYVISVHDLKSDDDLLNGFKWLDKNKEDIKKHLENIMPDYIKRCYELKDAINDLKKNNVSKKRLANKDNCTGCSACYNVCPKKCIEMVEDEKGFKYPKIDYSKCIRCNKCREVCPVLKNNISIKPLDTYAAFAKDKDIRNNSSSGGLFTLFAKEVINNKGVVVGATLNGHRVEHIIINKEEDLDKLRRSKYVQSDLNNIYKEVKDYLDKNITVLFSGTACQIAGLKSYLNKDYVNLICLDVVCHGVPSPKIFDYYLNEVEKKYKIKVTDVNFRSKVNGWNPFNLDVGSKNKLVLSESISENIYMKAFLQNLILRPSCYNCHFKDFKVYSDITLGDYWGVEIVHNDDKKFLDNKGVSLITLNSVKGIKLFDKISKELYYKESNIDEACKYNTAITTSVGKSSRYDEFWDNVDYSKIGDMLDEYTK
ncbi:MAG: Coenzyme F420 hydrogenase/dehydrogenase, beta subunit C-terminal domain [Bacilli bacterium]|nr:Coenzyme F420 hydrogenase/dehydrogenase, beta subunit C-terminal domain [Bacilli bacterium]